MMFQKLNARKQAGRWARTAELGRSSVWLRKSARVYITAGLGLQMLREDGGYLSPEDPGLPSTQATPSVRA